MIFKRFLRRNYILAAGEMTMSRLYDLKQKVEEIIERKGLDPIKTKGAISLKVGVVLSIIRESTPDDPEKYPSHPGGLFQ